MAIRRKSDSSRGAVLVELALLLPVMLLLIFGCLEFGRIIRVIQISAQLSREAASQAYRDCSGDRSSKLQLCLNELQTQLQANASQLVDGLEIIISIYVYDTDGVGGFEEAVHSEIPIGGKLSKFSADSTSIIGTSSAFAESLVIVAIGEVYIDFESHLPALEEFLFQSPGSYYDATVL